MSDPEKEPNDHSKNTENTADGSKLPEGDGAVGGENQELQQVGSSGTIPKIVLQPTKTGSGCRRSSPTGSTHSCDLDKLKVSDSNKRTTRSSATSVPAEYLCRLQSQSDRIDSFKTLHSQITSHSSTAGMAAYDHWHTHSEQLFKEFKEEHAKLEESCPAALYQHNYFTQRTLYTAELRYSEIAFQLAQIKEVLQATGKFIPTVTQASSGSSESTRPKLPEIKLIKFSGSYADWPAYKEMYHSMIMNNKGLIELDKLNYLRGSLAKEPLEVIQGLPLASSSLKPSLDMLTKRYENKRYIVQSYLDMLHSTAPAQTRNAAYLNHVTSAFAKARQALLTLIDKENLADIMFVSLLVRSLDKYSKEAWETHTIKLEGECTFDHLYEFLVSRIRALERLDGKESVQATSSVSQRSVKANIGTTKSRSQTSTHSSSSSTLQAAAKRDCSYPCSVCHESGHYIVMCPRFKDLTIEERRGIVVAERLCFNCLGLHSVRNCKLSAKYFSSTHAQAHIGVAPSSSHQVITHRKQSSLLATAIAHLVTPHGNHSVRLLIDPGSEISFISNHLVNSFGLKRSHSFMSIFGIGGTHSARSRGEVTITIKSIHRNLSVQFSVAILNKLSSFIPSTPCNQHQWNHLSKLCLADPRFGEPRAVDIIIGVDAYTAIIKPNIIKGISVNEPMAQLSIFGWLVLGAFSDVSARVRHSLRVLSASKNDHLNDLLTKFWLQEEIGISPEKLLTPEENLCENHFVDTHKRDSTGRYIVRLPLKQSASVLGDSSDWARACLRSMVTKLNRNSTYKKLYNDFMNEYDQLGHMEKIQSSEKISPVYYLPHHGVLKPDSLTTKLRVVFNGSAVTSSGQSLNDIMYAGPNLLLNIVDVLIWIRSFRLLFATDITKMYRQILVDDRDVDLQRIIWIDEHQNETHWRLKTVTYGTRAAPFLAVRSLLQLVKDEGHKFPLAINSLTNGRYVDNIFGGADNFDQLKDISQDLTNLCLAGGFPLAKWSSNCADFRSELAQSNTSTTISLDDCKAKLLGLYWDTHEDSLKFKITLPPTPRTISKRSILSEVAQIFDPLGIISPVTITAKALLQSLWLQKSTWDEPVPETLRSTWLLIRNDLARLNTLSLPRWLGTTSESSVQLHGFSDASQLAMSAVVYIRVLTPVTGISSHFLISKMKVAPIKPLSIPRLELAAAHLLAKLFKYITDSCKLQVESTHLWTDFQVTLTWIKSHPSRWKDFVRNRVAQIQELTPSAHWRHVPGSSNPADCASRGLTVDQLSLHNLWWHGPSWLCESEEKWPAQKDILDISSVPEGRKVVTAVVATHQSETHWLPLAKFSSLIRLTRVTATVLVACNVMRKLTSDPIITVEALDSATQLLVTLTQQFHFSTDLALLKQSSIPKGHVFNRLTAFIDSDGILRVGGRLTNAQLNQTTTHPAILPRNSLLTKLLIDHAHRFTQYGGTQLTLAQIRQEYWIIGGRAPVKSHILHCVICARQRAKRAQQLMGQLPKARVTPARPFTHTGIHYAGPLTIKAWKGRGSKTHKGWICVFVCFATSAVHLETVSDYSTEGFLAAFQRFSSRRGTPAYVYSDCGTHFKGAEKQFKEWLEQAQQEVPSLSTCLTLESTQWSFNPPAAPHMGGKWEAAVKLIKFHLKRTIGDTAMTFEELTTLLAQIERILNSRPLEPLSDDPEDIAALTPGHFLVGTALTALPERSLLDLSISRLSRWQLIQ